MDIQSVLAWKVISMDNHPIADPNVLQTRKLNIKPNEYITNLIISNALVIVHQTKNDAPRTSVLILVKAHVEKMLNVEFKIAKPSVLVSQATQEIHSVDALSSNPLRLSPLTLARPIHVETMPFVNLMEELLLASANLDILEILVCLAGKK